MPSNPKLLLLPVFIFSYLFTSAQLIDSLNTAKNCLYMKPEEREMIYEINRVRSNPRSYLQYIEPMLKEAQQNLKEHGKGGRNYSLTYSTVTVSGKEVKTIDTTWHYITEENVKALSSLVNDLKKLKQLSVLQPEIGIYLAAREHAIDNNTHEWRLLHTGSNGSYPWDRIKKYAPAMNTGNENIAGSSGRPVARNTVIQLLVDGGIPGYGHRYNLLDPKWTHVACTYEIYNDWMCYWVQNFGAKKQSQ
ncbi:MAG: CAP domain-containing protein [Chitinophagaceae bacterium]